MCGRWGRFRPEYDWISPTAKRFNPIAQGKRSAAWVGGWGRTRTQGGAWRLRRCAYPGLWDGTLSASGRTQPKRNKNRVGNESHSPAISESHRECATGQIYCMPIPRGRDLSSHSPGVQPIGCNRLNPPAREEAADVRGSGFSRNPGEEPPEGGTHEPCISRRVRFHPAALCWSEEKPWAGLQ